MYNKGVDYKKKKKTKTAKLAMEAKTILFTRLKKKIVCLFSNIFQSGCIRNWVWVFSTLPSFCKHSVAVCLNTLLKDSFSRHHHWCTAAILQFPNTLCCNHCHFWCYNVLWKTLVHKNKKNLLNHDASKIWSLVCY